MNLLKLSLMFPLRVACAKHLFSKMKLIKTCLRNQLGETNLDSLLWISTESPTGFKDDEYKYFVDEMKCLTLSSNHNIFVIDFYTPHNIGLITLMFLKWSLYSVLALSQCLFQKLKLEKKENNQLTNKQ